MEIPLPFTKHTHEITKRIVAHWAFSSRRPVLDPGIQLLMRRYVNTCFFALRHGLDVKPATGLPHMPTHIRELIINHAAYVNRLITTNSLLERIHPKPLFPTDWSPLVRSSILNRERLYEQARTSYLRRARARRARVRPWVPRIPISLPAIQIWGTAALAGATAIAMYAWKNAPDPKELHKLPIGPGEIFSLMFMSDFDNHILPPISGRHTDRDYGFTSGVQYQGTDSLYLQTQGDRPEDISFGEIAFSAPPPLMNRLTLTFAFNVSRWTNDSFLGFSLAIPLPHKTLHAQMSFGWDGWPGWWYLTLYTNDGFVPLSAGLRLKMRDWAICRVEIQLPLGLYTRAFFHSTDFSTGNMLLKQLWNVERTHTHLKIHCGSRTKDSVRTFINDVALYNHGDLLPGYEMQDLIDSVAPWLDFSFGQP